MAPYPPPYPPYGPPAPIYYPQPQKTSSLVVVVVVVVIVIVLATVVLAAVLYVMVGGLLTDGSSQRPVVSLGAPSVSGVDVTFRGTSCRATIARALERIAAAAGVAGSCGPGAGSEEPGVDPATTRDERAMAVPLKSARRWIIRLP